MYKGYLHSNNIMIGSVKTEWATREEQKHPEIIYSLTNTNS